jgi:hypothetical protein
MALHQESGVRSPSWEVACRTSSRSAAAKNKVTGRGSRPVTATTKSSSNPTNYRGPRMKMDSLLIKPLAAATMAALSIGTAYGQDTIKVGILH